MVVSKMGYPFSSLIIPLNPCVSSAKVQTKFRRRYIWKDHSVAQNSPFRIPDTLSLLGWTPLGPVLSKLGLSEKNTPYPTPPLLPCRTIASPAFIEAFGLFDGKKMKPVGDRLGD
jgi:hypothetical protein